MTTKIDLAEIALIAESFRHGEVEIIPDGWKAMRIAAALEALPKLVEIVGELKGFCEESIEEFNYPKLNELLDYFTAKTPQP
jgi:hypothetical protein